MSPDVTAIREAVGWRRAPELALLALRGEDARDALLHLCPSRLFLRDAQVKESLLLDDAGRPIADVLVCADDEDYLLLVEGLSPAALRAHVEAHLPPGCAPTLEDMGETHVVVSVHGPWAWEHVSKVLGDDMMALPYLNFFRVDHGLCVRAGKTGEFGYDLVVERDAADALMADIERHGEALDGEAVSLEAVSLCRFENGFFDPAHVPVGVTPLELQLGWRLDLERDWVGRAAIDARLREGVARRLVCMVADGAAEVGAAVRFEGAVIGRRFNDYWQVPVIDGIRRSPTADQLKHLPKAGNHADQKDKEEDQHQSHVLRAKASALNRPRGSNLALSPAVNRATPGASGSCRGSAPDASARNKVAWPSYRPKRARRSVPGAMRSHSSPPAQS